MRRLIASTSLAAAISVSVSAQGQGQGQGSVASHQEMLNRINDLALKLDEVPPAWSRSLSASDTADACNSSRFKCVMDGNAVLDSETGLVWERTPDDTTTRFAWSAAKSRCLAKTTGNRKGWRLPSIHELWSLAEIAAGDATPQIPAGHPFLSNLTGTHWSSSTNPANDEARAVDLQATGGMFENDAVKTTERITWCVRGGTTNAGEAY